VLHLSFSFLVIAALFTSVPCLEAGAECGSEDARLAEQAIDHLKTWDDLHAAFKRYHNACDDGAIAEGYSDFVARGLANDWDRVAELNRLTARHAAFRAFVLRHIDGTAARADLQRAAANARTACPVDSAALCSAIRVATKRALRKR
jgi:hypothetical protein